MKLRVYHRVPGATLWLGTHVFQVSRTYRPLYSERSGFTKPWLRAGWVMFRHLRRRQSKAGA